MKRRALTDSDPLIALFDRDFYIYRKNDRHFLENLFKRTN